MAQSRSEKNSVEKLLLLVEQLHPEEQEELRVRLNSKAWGKQWDDLAATIQRRFAEAGEPLPTEKEVMAQLKAVRNPNYYSRRISANH